MKRAQVRTLKRAVRAGLEPGRPGSVHLLSQESALALLARSIDFGHRRLAICRLSAAVQVGARVPPEHWLYCAQVIAIDPDPKLHELYGLAVARASAQVSVAPLQ
jgi:hypothetical protein